MLTTPGRYMVQQALPQQYRNFEGALDGKAISALFTRMAKELPSGDYVDVLQKMQNIGNDVAAEYGGPASVHLRDLVLPEKYKLLREQMRKDIYNIQQRKDITSAEKGKAIIDYTRKMTATLDNELVDDLAKQNNSFGLMAKTGVKGKAAQIRQILFGDLLTVDSNMKTIPYPTLRSYAEGITPLEYWNASHGGRKGYVDIQAATQDAGYLSKRVRQIAHRQVITADDCKKAKPFWVDGDDDDNIGTLLQQDTLGKDKKTLYKAGTLINETNIDNMPEKIAIRSAVTCGQHEGICSKCAGIRENNKFAEPGDIIGLNAVNSFLEGVQQSAISSKHKGGEEKATRNIKTGFKAISQFIDMPENFVGGALVAPEDGIVGETRPAPQGGTYVSLNGKEYHVSPENSMTVKRGDRVEAGDILSTGMIDTSKVLEHKNIGETRKQFVDAFNGLLKQNGAGTLRRNVEALARGYISKVEITDPDGVQGHIAGDIVDYDDLASKWKPRANTVAKSTADDISGYLETPVLHYSIGTRVTPKVLTNLRDNHVTSIDVNPDPAPFQPTIIRAKQFVSEDKDWVTSLAGENLMRTLQKKVVRGADTEKDSTSYYPRMAFMSYEGSQVEV